VDLQRRAPDGSSELVKTWRLPAVIFIRRTRNRAIAGKSRLAYIVKGDGLKMTLPTIMIVDFSEEFTI